MSENVQTIQSRSNRVSDSIENSSSEIIDVIPRDTMTTSERYIIFTSGDELPEETKDLIDEYDFTIVDMNEHAIDYEHKESRMRATYMARMTQV